MANNGATAEDDPDAGTRRFSFARYRVMPSFKPLRGLRRTALDLLLPPVCLGCQARILDHDALCPRCWRQITFIRPPLCDRLGIPLTVDTGGVMLSAAAIADPPDYDRARAVAQFDGLMRVLIHGFKFHDSHNARRLFGRWLAVAGAEVLADADVLVYPYRWPAGGSYRGASTRRRSWPPRWAAAPVNP
jgi:hypothetical protein